jgi:hypothetical protein
MKLVRKIAENYKLPYYTMSPTYSVCADHGYISGEVWKCPICGKETEVYSRITGYYRPVKNWNEGKTQEFQDRQTYLINENENPNHVGPEASCSCGHPEKAEAPKVTELMLFTSPTCPNCKMAKMLLDKEGIKYKNIDATTDKEPPKPMASPRPRRSCPEWLSLRRLRECLAHQGLYRESQRPCRLSLIF